MTTEGDIISSRKTEGTSSRKYTGRRFLSSLSGVEHEKKEMFEISVVLDGGLDYGLF